MTKPRYKWRPLQRGVALPPSEQLIQDQIHLSGASREQVLASLAREEAEVEIWMNDIYQVTRRVLDFEHRIVHLNIRRRDGGPIMRDWRHFQRIKNELIGEECEAVELYPAESRLVDTSNKYHLIGVADPEFRFPFGDIFGNERDVCYESGGTPGTRLPENFQQGEYGQRLEEWAAACDSAADELETIAEALREEEGRTMPKKPERKEGEKDEAYEARLDALLSEEGIDDSAEYYELDRDAWTWEVNSEALESAVSGTEPELG